MPGPLKRARAGRRAEGLLQPTAAPKASSSTALDAAGRWSAVAGMTWSGTKRPPHLSRCVWRVCTPPVCARVKLSAWLSIALQHQAGGRPLPAARLPESHPWHLGPATRTPGTRWPGPSHRRSWSGGDVNPAASNAPQCAARSRTVHPGDDRLRRDGRSLPLRRPRRAAAPGMAAGSKQRPPLHHLSKSGARPSHTVPVSMRACAPYPSSSKSSQIALARFSPRSAFPPSLPDLAE